jgi:hypothetical protein
MLEGDELEKIVGHDEQQVRMRLRSPRLQPIFVAVPTEIVIQVKLCQNIQCASCETRWGALAVKPPNAVATRPPGEGVAPAGAEAARVGAGGDATGATGISFWCKDFSSTQSFGTCIGFS